MRMKQLQWDKLPLGQAAKTLWGDAECAVDEEQVTVALKSAGLLEDMETEFRAQVYLPKRTAAKTPKKEWTSHLPLQTRQGIELVLRRVQSSLLGAKHATPEQVAHDIVHCNRSILDQGFLTELLRHYPEREVQGQLAEYRNASNEQLRLLHPADRLVVLLMTVPHLKEKVQGLLYYTRYRETHELIETASQTIRRGADQLLHAPLFTHLLRIILAMGNFLNATGMRGGAFGFKIASVNKLVDTKASDGTTLLHFVQRCVSKCFPDTEAFLEELDAPAEASRGMLPASAALPLASRLGHPLLLCCQRNVRLT